MVQLAKYSLSEIPLAHGAAGFLSRGGAVLSKGGRHRNDRRRHPNGQTHHHENIIPEGIAMRRMAALEGGYSRDRRGDLVLTGAVRDFRAENPNGTCRARGLTLEVEYQAGERFQRQHRRQIERARTPRGTLGNLQPSGEGSIASPATDDAEDESHYLASRAALRAAGSRPYRAVLNIVIHHHWPRFLDTARARPPAAWLADARDLEALRAGLAALARAMSLRGEKGDDLSFLILSLEEKLDRRPTEAEISDALLHDSVKSFELRREQRDKREAPR